MDEKTITYFKDCRKDAKNAWKKYKDKYYQNEYVYWNEKYLKAKADKQTKEQEK